MLFGYVTQQSKPGKSGKKGIIYPIWDNDHILEGVRGRNRRKQKDRCMQLLIMPYVFVIAS